MSFSIKGRTVIVTGASSGVGLAIVKQFYDEGANIVLSDNDKQMLEETRSHFGEKCENICIFPGDLHESLYRSNLMAACLDKFGRVDILINAFRVIRKSDNFDKSDATLKMLFEHNLFTTIELSKIFARQISKQNEDENEKQIQTSAIVNMSSIYAHLIRPEFMEYSIAAGSIENVTRAMAIAYAEKKIRVNAIAYDLVMGRNLLTMFAKNRSLKDSVEKITPLGRIANAHEVAVAAQFLASDAAQFITGQVLMMDGGRTLHDSLPKSLF